MNNRVKWACVSLAVWAGVHVAAADDSECVFFRLLSSTNSRIESIETSGVLGWSSDTLGATVLVQRAAALFAGDAWTNTSYLVGTGAVSQARIFLADTPRDMVFVPDCVAEVGDAKNEGDGDERPLHAVSLSGFLVDRYEVTWSQWQEIHAWAVAHGYSFQNAGSGKDTNHPVHSVSWHDVVKWCNARSEFEGKTPCYYTTSLWLEVYRQGTTNISADCVAWDSDGYRLPTEAEWEAAARASHRGRRFAWSDTDEINHNRANYFSDAFFGYDTSETRGYHPVFGIGEQPYSSPVGYFPPNGYGLYDMIGNSYEWCWDWYDDAWYAQVNASAKDTRGPTSSPYGTRVLRGGSWRNSMASGGRTSFRSARDPSEIKNYCGFRCVRAASP